jgi:hypothetical protein
VQELDAIMTHLLRNSPSLMAAWKTASRIQRDPQPSTTPPRRSLEPSAVQRRQHSISHASRGKPTRGGSKQFDPPRCVRRKRRKGLVKQSWQGLGDNCHSAPGHPPGLPRVFRSRNEPSRRAPTRRMTRNVTQRSRSGLRAKLGTLSALSAVHRHFPQGEWPPKC